MSTLQKAFVLEVGDVLMHRGEGAEAEAASDLFVGRRVAVLLREARKEVDDLFLTPCDCHAEIVANKKRIASGLLTRPVRYGDRGWDIQDGA